MKEDDKVIQSGDLALSTAPLSQELVHIPYKKPALIPGKEYRLMLHAVLKKDLSHVLLREGEQVTVEYRIAQKLSAPVKKGSCAGAIYYKLGGMVLREYQVETTEDMEKLDFEWCLRSGKNSVKKLTMHLKIVWKRGNIIIAKFVNFL